MLPGGVRGGVPGGVDGGVCGLCSASIPGDDGAGEKNAEPDFSPAPGGHWRLLAGVTARVSAFVFSAFLFIKYP